MDDAGAVPSRRLQPVERCADADRKGTQRRIPVTRLLHDRLGAQMAIAKRPRTELATQRFDYAPAPESTDHVKIEKRYDLFIGGRMVKAHSQKHFPTINPATEEKLSEVVEADEVDVDHAVKAAAKAFDSWSRIGP